MIPARVRKIHLCTQATPSSATEEGGAALFKKSYNSKTKAKCGVVSAARALEAGGRTRETAVTVSESIHFGL